MTTIRQFRPARRVILFLAIAGGVALTGCYTLVQHPRVESLGFRRPQGKSCTGCHTAQEATAYLRPERLTAEPPPWDSLARPWWVPPDSSGGDG